MDSSTNPFNASFGKFPANTIERSSDLEEIYNSFDNINPESNLYILTGPRGCGKTVSLIMLSSYYKQNEDWIVVNINPNVDILEQLAGQIYEKGKVRKLFLKNEFNFSFSGLTFSLKGENPVSNLSTILEKIFIYLKSKKKKVLVLVDEVANNQHIRVFSQEFQIFLRENYDIYMVMTGLYENISDLQNENTLTFLYRAPKINLAPLNLHAITSSYMNIFKIKADEAILLAKLTKGYAFAYQLLGSILYKAGKKVADDDILCQYDLLLDERVYSKIYSELTIKEREILKVAATKDNTTNSDIQNMLNMSKGTLSVYKARLFNKGLLDNKQRGVVKFILPRFREFLQYKTLEEN